MKLYVVLAMLNCLVSMGTMAQTLESAMDSLLKIKGVDDIGPMKEGLMAVRKANQWGFLDGEGNLAIDFRDDVVWNKTATATKDIQGIRYPEFNNGRCPVQRIGKEGIPYYGYMDKEGTIVIEPQFLNLSPFRDGRAIGIFVRRTERGKNAFQLQIYEYVCTEVVLDTLGEIIWPIAKRENLGLESKRFQTPPLHASFLSSQLLAVRTKDHGWSIYALEPKTPKP